MDLSPLFTLPPSASPLLSSFSFHNNTIFFSFFSCLSFHVQQIQRKNTLPIYLFGTFPNVSKIDRIFMVYSNAIYLRVLTSGWVQLNLWYKGQKGAFDYFKTLCNNENINKLVNNNKNYFIYYIIAMSKHFVSL